MGNVMHVNKEFELGEINVFTELCVLNESAKLYNVIQVALSFSVPYGISLYKIFLLQNKYSNKHCDHRL